MRRAWRRRAVGLLVLVALVLVVLDRFHIQRDPTRVGLVVTLTLLVFWVVLDSVAQGQPAWTVPDVVRGGSTGVDPLLTTYVRVLEDHATTRDPGPALRDRLAALAARRLAQHHGLSLTDPDARTLLGPELVGVLTGPVRRLRRAELESLLSRIEQL